MNVHELLRACERAPEQATGLFESFLASNTVPILEEDRATFLYRGAAEAVYLVHWVYGLESRRAFYRVPLTDVWYLSQDLPHGARVEYKLEIVRDGRSEWIKDPLNPHLAYDPFGSNSVCRMTGYHDPPWALPDPRSPKGTVDGMRLGSTVWGGARDVQLYLPAEYKKHKRYPLIVCHDGADYLRYASLATVLDNLIARHEVHPVVVALTSGVSRNEEYAANPLQARYVVEDLVPAVERVVGLSDNPRDRGLMGASFGGVTSLYTAWSHPGRFRNLLLQSGSFVFTDVGHHGRPPLWDPVVGFVNAFRRDPARVDARIAMSCGIFERLIYYNRSLVPVLRQAGLQVRFTERPDGHNWVGWRDALRFGLAWLYPGHLWMTYD